MEQIGFDHSHIEYDQTLADQTFWFDESTLGSTMTDFFQKRPVEYSKGTGIAEDELF
jgi:ribonucleotide reductase beta subunit family protein with ferritin-like domain